MKKTWSKPGMKFEGFAPNEYVSACYYTYCMKAHGVSYNGNTLHQKYAADGSIAYYDDNDTNGAGHRAAYCGAQNHYSVNPATGSGYEINTDGQGDLKIQNLQWTDNGDGVYGIGDWLTWDTFASDGRKWHHYGQITAEDNNHPNRS